MSVRRFGFGRMGDGRRFWDRLRLRFDYLFGGNRDLLDNWLGLDYRFFDRDWSFVDDFHRRNVFGRELFHHRLGHFLLDRRLRRGFDFGATGRWRT